MLNTIKSRIIFITVLIMLVFSIILSCFTFLNLKNNKDLMIGSCDLTITAFVEKINKEITELEDTAVDLATIGEYFYRSGKSKNIAENTVKDVFKNHQISIGGGIWFEPNKIKSNLRRFCIYAFQKEKDKIVIDKNFSSESYDYLTQSWYIEIKPKLLERKEVGWSFPYYDAEGSKAMMATVGSGIYDESGNFVGLSTVDWKISKIVDTVSKMKPTSNSFALFADKENDFILVSTDKHLDNDELVGRSLKEIPWYSDNLQDRKTFDYNNTTYISYIKNLDNNMVLIVIVPQNELFEKVIQYANIMLSFIIVLCIAIAFLVYLILKINVSRPIEKLTGIAQKISDGDLNTEIKISKPREFANLASTFDKMINDIKNITKEKNRIESELNIARDIQYSALPNDFLADRTEFSIYATMDTAKEVGGDFYDFFFINPRKFMFLIADVSGKGVPAALFMMTSKTLIKSIAEVDYEPKKMFERINNKICEHNDQGYFVTLLAGIIDLTSGDITFVNCGHNPPLVKTGANYEYLKLTPNLVLGAMSGIKFNTYQTKLKPKDTVFLYTDGITENMKPDSSLYGEERLINCLNSIKSDNLSEILQQVQDDVNDFAVEKSDDRTMLIFKYNGCKITLKTTEFNKLRGWLENNLMPLEDADKNKIILATEEIFTNIASYAYESGVGPVEVSLQIGENEIVLQFADKGTPYNPLEHEDPDVNAKIDERGIGGLGLFMVKNLMSSVEYEYKDGKNILTLRY